MHTEQLDVDLEVGEGDGEEATQLFVVFVGRETTRCKRWRDTKQGYDIITSVSSDYPASDSPGP